MTSKNAVEKLKQVQRYSTSLQRFFRFVFALSVLSLVVGTLFMLFGPQRFDAPVQIGSTEYSGESVSTTILVAAFIGYGLRVGILLKLTFHLIKLFGLYANGSIFTARNVNQIRQIGITVLLIPALWILELIAPMLLDGDGQINRMMAFQSTPFAEVIGGTIIIVISWIMDVGRELQEEQDLVV